MNRIVYFFDIEQVWDIPYDQIDSEKIKRFQSEGGEIRPIENNRIRGAILQTGPDASQGLSVCDRETTIPAHIQNSYELRRKNVRLTITI